MTRDPRYARRHLVGSWGAGIRSDVRSTLEQFTEPLFVSVTSLWESEIKLFERKLWPVVDFPDAVATLGLVYLPIEPADAIRPARLPPIHKEPFDRMMIAQALNRGLTIVTHDRIFASYKTSILWT